MGKPNLRKIDLSGLRFGHWSVGSQSGNTKRGETIWTCICDCGTTRNVIGKSLRDSKSLSCGCQLGPKSSAATKKHDGRGTRLYDTWKNMRSRCRDRDNPHYGARSISVCSEWNDFTVFRAWAISSGYMDDLTIERKNNDRGYSPDNCTWIPKGEQSLNRSITRRDSEGTPLVVIARQNGINARLLHTRLFHGWSEDQATTWPVGKRRPKALR